MRTHTRILRATFAALLGLAGLALVAALPVIWLAVQDPFGAAAHPPDTALLAQFAARRALLERLAAMAEHDPALLRVGPDFTRPDDAITPERLALYRRLLADAGIANGLAREGDAIVFLVHTRGLAISGSAKGFAYRKQPVEDAVVVDGDLNAAAASVSDKNVLLRRRIDGDWWLELDMR